MSNIKLFQSKQIRSVWNEEEQRWYFSIVDVVGALSDSTNPTDYLKKMRKRDPELATYLGTNCPQVTMLTEAGKKRRTLAGNTTQILRIIQSIPSPKAEPFKLWLAKVGAERIAEIEDPELAQSRIRETYRTKGYSDEWIKLRERGMTIRDNLTDEWKNRGISESRDFSILTAEISKATFGLTPSEYKKTKDLSRPTENLRDHMTDLELVFTMLGEASTTEIARTKDAQGMKENKIAAKKGGQIAGDARRKLEEETRTPVVSTTNYKQMSEKEIRKLKK